MASMRPILFMISPAARVEILHSYPPIDHRYQSLISVQG
jgi:hypothetical protein